MRYLAASLVFIAAVALIWWLMANEIGLVWWFAAPIVGSWATGVIVQILRAR